MSRAWPWLLVALVLFVPDAAWAADAARGDLLEQYQGWNLFALYGLAFTAGLGASLTPCVYPMIPIVLGIFGARGAGVTRARALGLATLYVLGMGTTYAVLGTVFAMLGRNFSTVLADPIVVIPIVALYIALALSMFGAFEVNLPASWQARLASVGGNGAAGAFAMGLVGGFTAAPCTAPFATSLLAAVAKTGNLAVGASTMFVHALGIGVLYWVLAVFAGALPRSGRWMEWVKSAGGVGLLVAALYFLRPIVPALRQFGSPETWFLGASLAVAAVGLIGGAVHLSFGAGRAVAARKGLAVVFAVVGAFGAIAWALTPDRKVPWVYDEAAAFARARAEGKGVMVDFGADWCMPCAELEVTMGDDAVHGPLVDHFVPLKFDVTTDSEANQALLARYDAGTPTVIFLGADGTVLARIREAMAPGPFRQVLDTAIGQLRAGP